MAYDEKYRKRTIEYIEEGHTYKETCLTFKLSSSTLYKWLKQYRKDGSYSKRKAKAHPTKIDPAKLAAYFKAYPDAYQTEMAKEFGCTPAAVCIALKRLGYSRKKR